MADSQSMKIIPYTLPADILQRIAEEKRLEEQKKLQTVKPHKSHVGLYDAKTPVKVMPSLNSWEAVDVNGKAYPHKETADGVPYFLSRENPEEDRKIPQAIRKEKKVYQAPIDKSKATETVSKGYNPNGLSPKRLAALEEIATAKNRKPVKKEKPVQRMETVEITDTPLYEDDPIVTDDRKLVFDFGEMPEFDETSARSDLENAAARDHWYKMQKLNRGADLQYFDDMTKYRALIDGLENELNTSKLNKPSGLAAADLTMALAYGDQISGTKLAPHYKAPTAVKDWQDRVNVLEQLVAAKRGDIPEQDRQYINMREDNKIAREGEEGRNIRQGLEFDHDNQMFDKKAALEMWLAKNRPPSMNPWSALNYQQRVKSDQENRMEKLSKAVEPFTNAQMYANEALKFIDLNPDMGIKDGVGRMGWIARQMPVSERGETLRQYVGQVVSSYIKAVSGAAATDAEADRLAQNLGSGRWQSKEHLVDGINKLKAATDRAMRQAESGYAKDIQSMYRDNGGKLADDFRSGNPGPSYKAGDVINIRGQRMRFKGGDPKNQKNYEPLK